MIRCHLSTILGRRKLKVSDVARATGIGRGALSRLYHERAARVSLRDIDRLCTYLGVGVADLFEHVPDGDERTSGS